MCSTRNRLGDEGRNVEIGHALASSVATYVLLLISYLVFLQRVHSDLLNIIDYRTLLTPRITAVSFIVVVQLSVIPHATH
jgi:hypothetical protein